MVARIGLTQLPLLVLPVVLALIAALILGGVLGYTIKPAIRIPGPTQVLVVHDDVSSSAAPCLWQGEHKGC